MTLAICPGSFDPMTVGHRDVVERALTLFDEVIVVLATNSAKSYLFNDEERKELAEATLTGLDRVKVTLTSGLIADYAREIGANAIVKGLRNAADFDAETAMALLNRHISGVETVFIMGDPALGHVASSYVKELASYGGPLDGLVAEPVAQALKERFAN